jgi:nucleoside-diphosphate-sugar epimerase
MENDTSSKSRISPNAWVLVTGVNGLIASHIADQLLAAGFRVKGTVRNASKNQWIIDLMTSRHGPNRFQLVEVAILDAEGAWDGAVAGVAGVTAVAGSADLDVTDAEKSAAQELAGVYRLLEAASKESGVKSFVFTSSAWAAWSPGGKTPITLTEESWNDDAVRLHRDGVVGMVGYMAVKVKVEQAVWQWIARHQPRFSFNTILPDTVLGPILDATNQSGSTAGMMRWLWDGASGWQTDILQTLSPQWFIDPRDLGRLYMAALLSETVNGRRLFGFAERYSWAKVAEIIQKLHPERGLKSLSSAGWDQTEVPNHEALALLQGLGQKGWTPLETAVEHGVDSFKAVTSTGRVGITVIV